MSTELTVTRTEAVTPTIRRVWFQTEDLSAFDESVFTDRYVKLVFPKPGVDYPTLDMRALRGTLPPEELPVVRTYTAVFPDPAAGTLAIDFVVHGDEGVAGPWARSAQPGDRLLVNGPGGAYRPDPDADWHLLVGDESALPAVTAALELLATHDARPARRVLVVALVEDAGHEPALPAVPGAEVSFVHRASGGDLEAVVRALALPEGRGQAFVHGEAQVVMHGLRPYLLKEVGMDREQVSVSGYWRQGRSEEGFRSWKRELAEAETEAGSQR